MVNKDSIMFGLGKNLGETASVTQVALADGKVTLGEGMNMGKSFGVMVFDIIRHRSELGIDLKDGMDDEELENLKAGFDEGYEIPSDATEAIVEETFAAVVMIVNGVFKMVAGSKKAVPAPVVDPVVAPVDADPTV
jgi:hypothetical protein